MIKLIHGDCLIELKKLDANSVDAIVTDPPAGIGFMGKSWDKNKGGRDNWIAWMERVAKEALRVLKPGGHALVWALPRTSHWTATAWENGGFEVRDRIAHVFGSGFPKSHNIGKSVDKKLGNDRSQYIDEGFLKRNPSKNMDGVYDSGLKDGIDGGIRTKGNTKYEGWGTALKPAIEDWHLLRKPLSEKTIADNVLKWGTGGINIDDCRVAGEPWHRSTETMQDIRGNAYNSGNGKKLYRSPQKMKDGGRFPSHLILDDSDEVTDCFPVTGKSRSSKGCKRASTIGGIMGKKGKQRDVKPEGHNDNGGSAARYFKRIAYFPKASKRDRDKGLESFDAIHRPNGNKWTDIDYRVKRGERPQNAESKPRRNTHPTVKNTELMRYLITLITPKNGIVLDPFMGSGSTGKAAKKDGFLFIGIESDKEYFEIAKNRINH